MFVGLTPLLEYGPIVTCPHMAVKNSNEMVQEKHTIRFQEIGWTVILIVTLFSFKEHCY